MLYSPTVPRAEHRWIAAQRGEVMMKQTTKDRESHTEQLAHGDGLRRPVFR